ncbi:DoxX family protein [Lonepinella koalarum]|uniref:Putative oxidoreductase n=1 Tax=Lonepinella koalarum TaxID=53417 RepID=A0A4V2PTY5_9PAST|nr:DoxX family protein [Lonepinella koalarum]MDH2927428.1 DoxX subfamily protein [Lonepinella koalarum]TCK68431.1 putative oxidoreductase [Lonepinella koalarum]TFJ89682.1 DoxX family protein [Lonepinella koalarum]TYG35493.1 DoxX family protein [Lonepinella koalarum]
MSTTIEKINQSVNKPDLAKFILRVSFAFMFLLHGIHKVTGGIDFITDRFIELGLPAFFANAVYVCEIVVPIFIMFGVFTRINAFIGVISCIIIILVRYIPLIFALAPTGAWAIEGVTTYLFAFWSIMHLGSGKYALKAD